MIPPARVLAARARGVTRSLSVRRAARIFVGVGVLVVLATRVGAGPFLHGLLSLDAPTIGAAVVLYAIATCAAAWRWRLIGARLGLALPRSTAVGMYYRSQFLNTVLAGGVVGDVQRALVHGRSTENVGAATRAVVLERTVGQVVQLALAAVVLAWSGVAFGDVLLPPIGFALAVLAALAVPALGAAMASARVRRALRHERDELRAGLGSVAVTTQAVAASVVVVACHLGIFAIATAAVGASVSPMRMLTLAFVVLLAASVPLNIGGWGPREGVAGWAFAMAGLGASAGVSAATLYGALAIISVAPGVIVTHLASVITGRTHRDRLSVCEPELRHLPRWLPRLGLRPPARPLERSGPRPGG